ncbi:MAG: hypothetical protein ACHQ1E_14870, partial [Ktedonobacterales bacterium]
MSNISIEVAGDDPARVEQALAVLRGGLGDGFITDAGFMRYVAPPAGDPFRRALTAIDTATGRVAGALTDEIVAAEAIAASFLRSYELVRADASVRALQS